MYKEKTTKVIIYLVSVIICLAMLFPLLWGISSSFKFDEEIFKYAMPLSWKTFIPQDFTFSSYVRIFAEFDFGRAIMNTVIITVMTIVFGIIVNSLAGFAFATFEFKGKALLFGTVLLTFMIPFETIALPLYKIASSLGMVDTLSGMIIPCIANGLVLFLFNQFFKEIPKDLYESALLDGASWLTIFRIIVIPLSLSIVITAGLMIFISQWNAYLWPLIIGMSEDSRVIQTALGVFQQEKGTLWSCLYAASIVSAMVPLFFFLPLQKYYVEGITSSGIKG